MNYNILKLLILLFVLSSCTKKTEYKFAISSSVKMPEYTKLVKINKKFYSQEGQKFKFNLTTNNDFLFTTNYKLIKDNKFDVAVLSNSNYMTKDSSEKELSNIRSIIPINSRIFYIAFNYQKFETTNIQELFKNQKVTILNNETGFIKKVLVDLGVDISKSNFVLSKINLTDEIEKNLSSNEIDSISNIDFYNYYKTNTELPYDIEVGFSSQDFSSNSRLNKLLNSHKELKLFSLDDYQLFNSGSKAKGFCLRNNFFTPYLLPKGCYGEYPEEPVITIREDFILAAKEDIDEEFVYEFVKTAIEETDLIDMNTYGKDFSNIHFAFPLHEGTRRYLDKNSPKFFEKYGEKIGKFGAGVGGIYTALMGFLLWRKKRKRKTIVVDFERVLEIQSEFGNAKSIDELELMYKELQEIQQNYHIKMIDHKILVDDTLQIFFVLIDKVESYILNEIKNKTK